VNYAEEGMQVVQGTDAGFIKFGSRVDLFYLSELQSTLCLIKSSSGRENHYCYKSMMIEKKLELGFGKLLLYCSSDD
jgi:hypothetical protein